MHKTAVTTGEIGQAATVGALTYVCKDIEKFQIVSGNRLRSLGTRDRRILDVEAQYLAEDC